eukprot:1404963-Pyramimonas_sp.AAC.1
MPCAEWSTSVDDSRRIEVEGLFGRRLRGLQCCSRGRARILRLASKFYRLHRNRDASAFSPCDWLVTRPIPPSPRVIGCDASEPSQVALDALKADVRRAEESEQRLQKENDLLRTD